MIAAIQSFDEPIVLLAGGRDKNLPWEVLVSLIRERVDHLVVFGEARHKISKAIGCEEQPRARSTNRPYTISFCEKLQEAVYEAARVAEEGDVVLLSPGGTSFDEFRDFEDRGEAYRQWVMNLR